MDQRRIYLDHAASRPLEPEVIRVMSQAFEDLNGNPSSLHTSGRRARAKIEDARRTFAHLLKTQPRAVTFTSGASEANNLVLRSNAYRFKDQGKHIISSMGEHPSVYEPLKQLESEGFELTLLSLQDDGSISLDDFKSAIRQDTILVSIMSVNNETGARMPIEAIGQVCLERNIFFHSDIVQSFGKEEIGLDVPGLGAVTLSAHKIGGPKGMGLVAQSPSHLLQAQILGGGQEQGRRAGTENTPGILGFEKAASLAFKNMENFTRQMQTLQDTLYKSLKEHGIAYERNGIGLPWIQNIWFKGLRSDRALVWLDLEGIEVSAGSACSAGSLEASRILQSMYGGGQRLTESLRISFGPQTRVSDIAFFVDKIARRMEKI